MGNIQQLDRIPTDYSDELTAEHFIIGNKLKKQLKENDTLSPEERVKIADKLSVILGKHKETISKEQGELSNLSKKIKNNIDKAIKIEALKFRNYEGYTENDKKVMKELKEKKTEKYEALILDYGIEFTKDYIIINYYGKYQYDRIDAKLGFLKKEKITQKEASKLAKKQGKEICDRFHLLAEEFGNDFVVNLFQLKDGYYHTVYKNHVQHSNKIGHNIMLNTCDYSGTSWREDIEKVDDNYKAHVRLFKDLNEQNTGGRISITIE